MIEAYHMSAVFGTAIDEAVLESPIYNIAEPTCLQFRYLLSSPKVQLNIHVATSNGSQFIFAGRVLYSEQQSVDTWNVASMLLTNGFKQIRFIANKKVLSDSSISAGIAHVVLLPAANCTTTVNGE
jgi:hypothetical protein